MKNVVNKPNCYFQMPNVILYDEEAFISDFFEQVNFENYFLQGLKTSPTEGASALFKHKKRVFN